VRGSAERVANVVKLLLHDRAAVGKLGEGFRQGTAKTATHSRCQNYNLRGHDDSPKTCVEKCAMIGQGDCSPRMEPVLSEKNQSR
jgi:hypothetical protein